MVKLPNRVNFSRLASNLRARSAPLKVRTQKIYRRAYSFSQKRPLTSFGIILVTLLLLILVGNFISRPKTEEGASQKEPIAVELYSIGKAPTITVSAQIEKEGVITIAAQTPAIVNKVNVKEGQSVNRGQTLINLATNYHGGNAASVQRQLAGVQSQIAKENFDAQKDIITKQRDIAEKTDASSDQLRDITQKSLDETRSLVNLNENILSTIDQNIAILESTNAGGANDDLILQTKQLKSQLLAGTNQAKSALRASEFQTDENKAPAQLSNLAKDLTLKQLDLQEKTTKLNLEAANLQVRLAQVNEAQFFPAAPFSATVQRVHVRAGQQVAPGTPLVTISTTGKATTVVASVPEGVARSISKLDSSFLVQSGQKYEIIPIYSTTEAVNGQLYAVIFSVPEDVDINLTDKSFADIEIPISYSYSSESVPFVPLDSVRQTQDKTIIFVANNGKARAVEVTLGQVQGNFVEISSGLSANDQVIVSRNVVAGDSIKGKD